MQEEETIKIELELKVETVQMLQKIADYHTIDSLLEYKEKDELNIIDEIKGAIFEYLDKYLNLPEEKADWLHKIQNNKQYQLKNRFKQLLKEIDYKQVELIHLTGLPKSTVSQILSNNHEMSLRHFLLIWSALKYPPIEKVLYFEKRKE